MKPVIDQSIYWRARIYCFRLHFTTPMLMLKTRASRAQPAICVLHFRIERIFFFHTFKWNNYIWTIWKRERSSSRHLKKHYSIVRQAQGLRKWMLRCCCCCCVFSFLIIVFSIANHLFLLLVWLVDGRSCAHGYSVSSWEMPSHAIMTINRNDDGPSLLSHAHNICFYAACVVRLFECGYL